MSGLKGMIKSHMPELLPVFALEPSLSCKRGLLIILISNEFVSWNATYHRK